MKLKKISLYYLTGYLFFGGLGFAFLPVFTFEIFQSTELYSIEMIQMTGMFMMALGGLVGSMALNNDFTYYYYSIAARTFIVAFLFWLYFQTSNPLFLIINIIVLIGLLPSYYVLITEKMNRH